MTDTKKKIIEKLKKILRKGDRSRNPSDAEVDQALEIAKRIMAEHNISMSEVDLSSETSPGIITVRMSHGDIPKWKLVLASVPSIICGVEGCVQDHGNGAFSIYFIGYPEDVAIAKELYGIFMETIEKRSDLMFPKFTHEGQHDSYCLGFALNLIRRAEIKIELDSKADQDSLALVVSGKKEKIKEFFEANYGAAKEPPKKEKVDIHSHAFHMGVYDAMDVSLESKRLLPE